MDSSRLYSTDARVDILFVSSDPPSRLKPRLFAFLCLVSRSARVGLAHATLPPSLYGSFRDSLHERAAEELRDMGVLIREIPVSLSRALGNALVNGVKGRPLRASLYRQRRLSNAVAILCKQLHPNLIHVDRSHVVPMAHGIQLPIVVDLTDPLGYAEEKREVQAKRFAADLRVDRSRLLWAEEANVARQYPVFFASEIGCDRFRARVPYADCCCVPKTLSLAPQSAGPASPRRTPTPSLCFSGNLRYWPNVTGISQFIKTVWLKIKRELPQASLTVAGANPDVALRRLAREHGVFITANPPDMTTVLREHDLSIAPLEFCGGFPNKVTDAIISANVPILASPAAIVGLSERAAACVPTASTPEQWVSAIVNFRSDPSRWWRRLHQARNVLAAEYSADRTETALFGVYDAARRSYR